MCALPPHVLSASELNVLGWDWYNIQIYEYVGTYIIQVNKQELDLPLSSMLTCWFPTV